MFAETVGIYLFPFCIDVQVGFKIYCQLEYKEIFICCDKKIIPAECMIGNCARREKAW